jgi:hypothetical protein
MTILLTPKDCEEELLRISRELYVVAKAIEQLGDRMVAGELAYIQLILKAFTINPELRAREGGERTPEEWHQCNQFMLGISEIHHDFAKVILREMETAMEEKSTEEEIETIFAIVEKEEKKREGMGKFRTLMNALADSVAEARDEDILAESKGWSTEQTKSTLLKGISRFKKSTEEVKK